MRIFEYIKLIRIPQWYKNLVIFLSILFVGQLFNIDALKSVLLGFVALCFVSSANYILNDIIDMKRDRVHPEKKFRPLAAKKVSVAEALFLFILFLGASFYIAYNLGFMFFICVVFLFVFTLFYSMVLKKEAIADVIAISVNFVVRAVAGAFVIHSMLSPWLIVCPFFLALFLAVGKRESDLKLMKGDAKKHKEVLQHYNLELTNTLMIISTTCLIIAYSLYSFARTSLMLLTLPFAIYAIFRYYYLINIGSEIGRHPERLYKDWRIIIAGVICIAIILLIFYVAEPMQLAELILK